MSSAAISAREVAGGRRPRSYVPRKGHLARYRKAARRMKFRHLEVFWAVMRTGSEHGAARLLGISQPGVSKLLRYAEASLGMTLFERAKGRLYPPAGAGRGNPIGRAAGR